MSGVLVIAEHRRGEPLEITFELIAAGAELAAAGAGDVVVAAIGANAGTVAERCCAEGVAEVIAVETANPEFEPHVTQRAAEQLIAELSPAVVLAGHTVDSLGYAPALAAAGGLGFAPNVLSVEWDGEGVAAARGVYGDRLVAKLEFDRPTVVLMMRAGAYPAVARRPRRRSEPRQTTPRRVTTHLGYREAETGGVDITGSDFLLSIGRGIGDQESVEQFEELADKLGRHAQRVAPARRRGLDPELAAGRPVGPHGQAQALSRARNLGRRAAPRGHPRRGDGDRRQHRSRCADLRRGHIRGRRRSVRSRRGAREPDLSHGRAIHRSYVTEELEVHGNSTMVFA